MNVVIPMAGRGQRFQEAGYEDPKPLIDINGKPMIERVVENLYLEDEDRLIIICQDDVAKYVEYLADDIVTVPDVTEGAACTVLAAQELIENDDDLLIANADQIVDYSTNNFKSLIAHTEADAVIWLFHEGGVEGEKWSYARIDQDMQIVEVAEKSAISPYATCGIYYWRYGFDFVDYASQMIKEKRKVKNEYYICPVFNEALNEPYTDFKIQPFFVNHMFGLGTPEDLEKFFLNAAEGLL